MKILLVDDDPDVVQSLVALLQKLPGHDIRGATTGGQAIQSAMAMGGIDVLVTDVVMEPMDGFSLRDQIATRYPAARTIFISGYDLSDYAAQTANHKVLAKPIEQAELIAAIMHESLGAEPAAPEPEPAAVAEPEPEPVAAVAPEPTPPVAEEIPVAPIETEPEPEPEPEPVPEEAPVATEPPVPVAPPTPQPVAVPTPQPVAPVAVPVATAVPVVRAVPAASAAPSVRAVASPTAVPKVAVSAVPKVVAAAAPNVTAAAAPKVAATAVPKVSATAVPKVTATAAPGVAATAVPKVAATAVPSVAATAVPKVAATAVPGVAATAVPKVAATAVPGVAVPAAPKVAATVAPNVAATAAPKVVAAPKANPPAATVSVPKAKAAPVPAAPSIPKPTHKAPATVKAVAGSAAAAGPKAVTSPGVPMATPAMAPAAHLPDDEMVGQTIGAYKIQRVLGDGRWGRVYLALQTSINRPVALKLLDPKQASDETVRARFLGDARAKAHVQHPSIVAVYEAGEADGHVFYTHEFVDGRNLAQIQAAGEKLDEFTALKVLKAASDGLNYLTANHIPHSAPQPTSIYLATDGTPRLANLATNAGDEQAPVEQEIQALGRIMLSVLPSIQSLSAGFRTLVSRMVQAGPQAVNSWGALLQGIKAIEPKVIPVEAAKISAQDRAAIAAVESARKSQKRSLYINVASMASLVVLAALGVWWFFSTNERALDEQVVIPAGPFIFGTGQTVDLPEFSIDKYEVTIGQYAKFVQALEAHPTSEYDHEKQPRIKTSDMHKPRDWVIYYGRAAQGKAVHSVPSDLNMPVLMVDWWDAYAYAKWKGRELPTEQEWEKAARGTKGFIYPWGDNPDTKKVNSGEDFVATSPDVPGKIDGFNYWGSVDKQRDKSPFGVVGMAGNVAEWTATWTKDQKYPIIKGGNFMSIDVRLDKRVDNVAAHIAQENIGFRTVSHKASAK